MGPVRKRIGPIANQIADGRFCSAAKRVIHDSRSGPIGGSAYRKALELSLHVLLLTDADDARSSLPLLTAFARPVRRVPLNTSGAAHCLGADVAIVDGRADPVAAREACRRMAASTPAIALLAMLFPEDFARVGADWHVDDVLSASACSDELYTRLRLAVARRRQTYGETVEFGDLTIDPASYTVLLGNREVKLTLTEFKILNYLVQHAGRAITRDRLIRDIWGRDRHERTVNVYVQRLRAKLGDEHGSIVDTVRGVGYVARPPRPSAVIAHSA
ncbi:MAG TPA: winged-helix domain-containing protein [Mycobacterium sp.]|nr:winged-helix domain-containing protein [Mycobacterium sp.]